MAVRRLARRAMAHTKSAATQNRPHILVDEVLQTLPPLLDERLVKDAIVLAPERHLAADGLGRQRRDHNLAVSLQFELEPLKVAVSPPAAVLLVLEDGQIGLRGWESRRVSEVRWRSRERSAGPMTKRLVTMCGSEYRNTHRQDKCSGGQAKSRYGRSRRVVPRHPTSRHIRCDTGAKRGMGKQ